MPDLLKNVLRLALSFKAGCKLVYEKSIYVANLVLLRAYIRVND